MNALSSKFLSDRKSAIQNPKLAGLLAIIIALTVWVARIEAQQPGKIPRVGVLRPGAPADLTEDSFRQGLRELGYLEGKNIIVEYRYAEGRLDQLPQLAAEMVRLKPDVIVAGGGDLVALGIAKSLARPGGNLTGLSASAGRRMMGKRLEFLKEAFPKTVSVSYLWNPDAREAGSTV